MSTSKQFLKNIDLCQKVVAAYQASDKPTMKELSLRFNTTEANIAGAIRMLLLKNIRRLEHGLRVSRAQCSETNAMRGKTGQKHPGYKGIISDGRDSQMIKVNGHYVADYRKVIADAIGIDVDLLPLSLEVHHIDGNRMNNNLDNLCLCSSKAHGMLHRKKQQRPKDYIWEMYSSGTLK